MKVLYISNKPIYPKVDGGCVAMANFLNCLIHAGLEITHLCLETEKHPFSLASYPKNLRENIAIKSSFVDTKVTMLKAIKGLFTKGSYNVSRFYNYKTEQLILSTMKEHQYDAVIMESLFVTPYIEVVRNAFQGSIFVRTHNVEHSIWENLAKNTRNSLKSAYLKHLAKQLKKYEIDALNKVDGLLAITQDDQFAFKEIGVQTQSIYAPVAIPISSPLSQINEHSIFHLGAMDWEPNVEAVKRLIKLFPAIKEQVPSISLHIAGRGAKKRISSDQKDIHIHDYIEDLNAFVANAGVLVSPIISGSGVRIKVLEMMSMGVPVVTTSLGAQGIGTKNQQSLIIADSDEAIIKSVIDLSSNNELMKEIGRNAVNYIRKNHNIESVSSDILVFIKEK